MTHVCHKPSANNDICLKKWQCAEDLVCRPQNNELVCLPKGKVGDTCDSQNDCEKKLKCRKKYVTDKRYTCLEKGKSGEPCEQSSDCEEKLACRVTSREGNAPKKCLPKSTKGEFCAYPSDCEKP